MMGNRPLYKIELIHTLGTYESEQIKVAALNLFHPTAFPPLPKWLCFRYYDIASLGRGDERGCTFKT